MSKGKLAKFAEMAAFSNVIQPSFEEVFNKDFRWKGGWNRHFFKHDFPLTLELGCGKGEYTVELARRYPDRNFLGIDIKGSRIWKGAKTALEEKLPNAGFLRTRIDFIESFFAGDEVGEIWITFPDPQLKKVNKRLTSTRFLTRYRSFLQLRGCIHLKTDSEELYRYTKALALYNDLPVGLMTNDLYGSGYQDEIPDIKTFYEKIWIKEGKPIHYMRFQLKNDTLKEPPDDDR